ncbi:MAG: hypothetical protein R6X25_01070 [Candidatus Krumholzibacteriia bacterium]
MAVALPVLLGAAVATAQEIVVRALTEYGEPLARGEVSLRPPTGPVIVVPIGWMGTGTLDRDELRAWTTYRVEMNDRDGTLLYRHAAWNFDPRTTEPDFDPELMMNRIAPTLQVQGLDDEGLEVTMLRAPNPKYLEQLQINAERRSLVDLLRRPSFVGGIALTRMFGNFGEDEDFGVLDAKLGISLWGAYRFGYSPEATVDEWTSFRQLVFGYAQNRYTTEQILSPGSESNVAFHRFHAGYGVGRMRNDTHLSVDAVASLGGIYDGINTLSYLDRQYGLFGLGLRGSIIQGIVTGNVDVGLSAQFALLYYPADDLAEDHWYGLAPSVSLGAVIF